MIVQEMLRGFSRVWTIFSEKWKYNRYNRNFRGHSCHSCAVTVQSFEYAFTTFPQGSFPVLANGTAAGIAAGGRTGSTGLCFQRIVHDLDCTCLWIDRRISRPSDRGTVLDRIEPAIRSRRNADGARSEWCIDLAGGIFTDPTRLTDQSDRLGVVYPTHPDFYHLLHRAAF